MMSRGSLVVLSVAALLAVTASAESLTASNFDDAVFGSGKNAFIKFQAPW